MVVEEEGKQHKTKEEEKEKEKTKENKTRNNSTNAIPAWAKRACRVTNNLWSMSAIIVPEMVTLPKSDVLQSHTEFD